MIELDENALICDLAETYQIYDYKQLPLNMVAVFSCGLRDDSRIKMKMNDQIVPMETLMMAKVTDLLNLLFWSKTKDAQNGKNQPQMISEMLTLQPQKEKKELVFNSGEDFERMRKELLESANSGGEG